MKTIRESQIDGARRYAASDHSDPFAFSRAMTHINLGMCRDPEQGNLDIVCYDATPVMEMRTLPHGDQFSDGSIEYPVTVYHSARRL